MKNILFLLVICAILTACEEEKFSPEILKAELTSVNFSKLRPGQMSQFIHYRMSCDSEKATFDWTGDTLNLRVFKGETPETYYLEETIVFSSGSTSEAVLYPIEEVGGSVFMPERSQSALFFFYGADHLRLELTGFPLVSLQQVGCELHLANGSFTGDEIGYIASLTFGEIILKDKVVVSCVPIVIDMDAYLVYDRNQIYLSHTIVEQEFNGNTWQEISGWKLLEN